MPGAPEHSANGRTVTHSYTHNAWGHILAAKHDGETLTYAYDDIGRVESQTYKAGRVVSYDWDKANNLTKLTYPDGFAVDYTYDDLNRVTAAKHGSRTLAGVQYDALSRRKLVSYANGASTRFKRPMFMKKGLKTFGLQDLMKYRIDCS